MFFIFDLFKSILFTEFHYTFSMPYKILPYYFLLIIIINYLLLIGVD